MSRMTIRLIAALVASLAVLQAQTPPPAARTAQTARPAMTRMTPMMPGVNPALLKGLRYRLVGPSRGGRVTTVTGVPSQPATFYMGAASGGIVPHDRQRRDLDAHHRRQGAGRLDRLRRGRRFGSERHLPRHRIGRRAQQRVDGPRRVQDHRRRRDVAVRGPLQRRADWRGPHPSDQPQHRLGRRGDGDMFKANSERGRLQDHRRRRRRGRRRCTCRMPSARWTSKSSRAIRTSSMPGCRGSNASRGRSSAVRKEGGFYKSTNGGDSFTKITTGLPADLIGKGNLAVTAAKPDRVYALIEALPGGGFYRSDDAGQTWALMTSQASLLQRPFYYTTLGADPTNADVVYAGAESFFKSTDGGKTFTSFRTPHGDNHDIWISPKNGNIMIQSNDGGANVSTDGGRTWSSQNNQVTAEIYSVAMDNQFPFKIYARPAGHQLHDHHVEPGRALQPRRLARRARVRDRADHAEPARPEYRVRLVQRPVRVDEPEDRSEQELLDRRAVALRQSGARPDPAVPARVADGDVAARSGRAVLRVAVPAPHARQGRDVGDDFTGSHGERSVLPGRERRADHARRDGRGVLQHALRDHGVAARARRYLDGRERRPVLRDDDEREDVGEGHAEGPAAGRARAVD